jgi:hypothetical protein
MSFCRDIFQKGIYELQLSDLQSFFSSPQEETSILEFKSGNTALEKIYREVAAFLNTEGGILIIGAPQEKELGNKKVCHGDLDPALKILNQDSLMRTIASNISPSPAGIKMNSFDYRNGKVFIVEIPQSFTPPHQVSEEGKYYIRLEREAKPAPHGIVEALFQKRQRPRLTGDILYLIRAKAGSVNIMLSLENNSQISAERVFVIIEFHGVKEVVKARNLNSKPTLVDDRLVVQETLENNLLVQGTKLKFELEVLPRFDYFYGHMSFYCRDSRLETIAKLFSISQQQSLKRYSTFLVEDNLATMGEIYTAFQKMKYAEIARIFAQDTSHDFILANANVDFVYKNAREFGIEIPESYVDFISVTNGFQGTIRSREILFLEVQDVFDDSNNTGFMKTHFTLLIGSIDDLPVGIDFSDPDNVKFSWSHKVNRPIQKMVRESLSFYDILDFIQDK